MNTCQECKHYDFSIDDMDERYGETCNAPLPIFVEVALRKLECLSPEQYWDSETAGEFCSAFCQDESL